MYIPLRRQQYLETLLEKAVFKAKRLKREALPP
jgi:hypothetical protein